MIKTEQKPNSMLCNSILQLNRDCKQNAILNIFSQVNTHPSSMLINYITIFNCSNQLFNNNLILTQHNLEKKNFEQPKNVVCISPQDTLELITSHQNN